jgi:hypothetical protein
MAGTLEKLDPLSVIAKALVALPESGEDLRVGAGRFVVEPHIIEKGLPEHVLPDGVGAPLVSGLGFESFQEMGESPPFLKKILALFERIG